LEAGAACRRAFCPWPQCWRRECGFILRHLTRAWRSLARASMFVRASAILRKRSSRRAALTMAIQRQKPPPGLIHHSDRGSQCAAADYRKVLDAAGMTQSMSRKGNCWDNAPMDSCLGTIKTELVHQARYPSRDAARHDLFAYIEGYYNRQRLHSAVGYITPEQAERRAA